MAANYRYWCGECHYRTSWLTESEGVEQQLQHYARRHPSVEPGGRVEVRQGSNNGIGCLTLVGILFLLLLLAPTCQHRSSSAPLPPPPYRPGVSLAAAGSQPQPGTVRNLRENP
jgi:hypothetical protein